MTVPAASLFDLSPAPDAPADREAEVRALVALAGDGVGRRAPVAAVSRGVQLDGVPQVAAVEVGPQPVQEDHLGVGRLPHQEVRGALLA